jgi:hypothetical protein
MEYRLRQRAAMPPDESGRIDVMHADLTEGERRLLLDGLAQWGGPARPTNELAVALGFADLSDFDDQRRRLSDSLAKGESLSGLDATRALVATEIVFASDVFGAGVEWSTVTGSTDAETIAVLRQLQRKLVTEYRSFFTPP